MRCLPGVCPSFQHLPSVTVESATPPLAANELLPPTEAAVSSGPMGAETFYRDEPFLGQRQQQAAVPDPPALVEEDVLQNLEPLETAIPPRPAMTTKPLAGQPPERSATAIIAIIWMVGAAFAMFPLIGTTSTSPRKGSERNGPRRYDAAIFRGDISLNCPGESPIDLPQRIGRRHLVCRHH